MNPKQAVVEARAELSAALKLGFDTWDEADSVMRAIENLIDAKLKITAGMLQYQSHDRR